MLFHSPHLTPTNSPNFISFIALIRKIRVETEETDVSIRVRLIRFQSEVVNICIISKKKSRQEDTNYSRSNLDLLMHAHF